MEVQTLFGRLASDKEESLAHVLDGQVRRAVVKGKRASGRRAAWVGLDVEATGGSAADRIIQIAIVPFASNGEPMRGDDGQPLSWWTYVNPEGRVSNTYALQVHQITSAMTARAPRFRDVARRIWLTLADRVVVGHNLSYDLRMLAAEFERLEALAPRERERLGLTDQDYHLTPTMTEICTQALTRQWYKGQGVKKPKVGLKDACAALGVRLDRHHDALYDAEAAGRLYGCLMGWRERDPVLGSLMPDPYAGLETRLAQLQAEQTQRALEAEYQRALEARLAEEARQPIEGCFRLRREVRLREIEAQPQEGAQEALGGAGGHLPRREVVYPRGAHVEVLARPAGRWEVRVPASPEPRRARLLEADAVEEVAG
jgi:DNA polymerase III epsilon subunit-like protein